MSRARGAYLVVVLVGAGLLVVAARAMSDAPSPVTSRPAADQRTTGMTLPSEQERRAGGGDAPTGVRHHSARLEDVEPADKPRPTRLRIDALGVDAEVMALGVAASGEMDVPTNAETVAWYEYGPSPGQRGSAVLAAHVDYNGQRGVFFELADLNAGATVSVEFADARPRTFTVVDSASIAKKALPVDQLFRRDGRSTLTLITCGGEFDPATRSYRNNIVVRALPS
jgi:hypothetical protein